MVRMKCAAATAPVMEASWLLFGAPLPQKYYTHRSCQFAGPPVVWGKFTYSSTALRHLENNGRVRISGSFESRNSGRARSDVHGRDGEVLLLCVLEELANIFADNDTSLALENVFDTHNCDWLCVFEE